VPLVSVPAPLRASRHRVRIRMRMYVFVVRCCVLSHLFVRLLIVQWCWKGGWRLNVFHSAFLREFRGRPLNIWREKGEEGERESKGKQRCEDASDSWDGAEV